MKYSFLIVFHSILIFSCNNTHSNKTECDFNNKNSQSNLCCENINKNHRLLSSTIKSNDSIKIKFTAAESSMKLIKGGIFIMGGNDDKWSLNREYPRHKVQVNSFYMDVHEVTNAQFKKFVDETGYVTLAEKKIDWKSLKLQFPENTPKPPDSILEPGSLVFFQPKPTKLNLDYSQWWKWVKGACWKHPFGPESNINNLENHPVVHVSYKDAEEFAKWCNKRLPTEAEWEWAARGGLKNKTYPWGNEHIESGKPKCNLWTGNFPVYNSKKDGYKLTSPVMNYDSNGYGLYDMAGNVWEICSDWYDENYYDELSKVEVTINPKGPQSWNYPREPNDPKKVMRGGSFLCNDSYCASYRVSARMPYSIETGMNHTGFRCVKDI